MFIIRKLLKLLLQGILLSEYSPYIKEIFKNNKEVVFFNDNKFDLLKIVKYYLINNKLRENIKINGFKKINKGLFNYSSQLLKIINFTV